MFDWDDLRYFLAVARHGSTIAAGRALKSNQSTVQRRVAALERRLGQRLVKRQPTGYRLTEVGQAMLPLAERVEQAVQAFEQHLESSTRDIVGVVRVTCPEPLVSLISQSGLLERFYARYPGLSVEFVMSDKALNLAKGEADVALRAGHVDDVDLVGRKIADTSWGVYASPKYIARHGKPERIEDLEKHRFVGFDGPKTNHRATKWLHQVAPNAKIVARNNSMLGLVYAVKSGIGLAPLPKPIADRQEDLVCVLGPIPELTTMWRLLVHADARRTPRVSAFFDFIVEEIETLRPILTG